MNINGTITISRPRGDGAGYIKIEIEDKRSSISFCEVQIPLADFADALTGQAYVDCNLEIRGLKNVGKIREHKREFVPLVSPYNLTDAEIEAALVPFETDGWVGSRYDIENSRNYDRKKGHCLVSFVRYVDTSEQDAANG